MLEELFIFELSFLYLFDLFFVEPGEALTIFPKPVFLVAFAPGIDAVAMLLTLFPPAAVLSAVCPSVLTVALLFV